MTSENSLQSKHSHWLIRPPESTIAFSVTFRMEPTATGRIREFSGTIDFDEDNPTASAVEVTIDPTSIDTGEPERDDHLGSADFFDVARFPSITFKSHTIAQQEPHVYEVRGSLAIRDVVEEIAFQVTHHGEMRDYGGKRRARFTGRTELIPADFGLTWNLDLSAGWIPTADRATIVTEVDAIEAD